MENTIPYPVQLPSKYYFYGCLVILVVLVVINAFLVRAYLKLGIKLKMLKEGGLTPQERGLVLGHAADGRSRTSTEIDMTRDTSNTYDWASKLTTPYKLQSNPNDLPKG